ncbi:MAG: MFS transporter, partial [Sphingomonadales bacterium]
MTIESGTAIGEREHDKSFFGHPKGLQVLFMTEMWERFSYYGMRALLIFYLTQHFLFRDNPAFAIYGAYTALVYLTPVIGGLLADRYLGSRKAVTFGAILLVLGQFGMAIQGDEAQQVIEFEGQEYQMLTEGRSADAERFLVISGEQYAVEYTSNQWLVLESPSAILPARIDRKQVPEGGGEPETVYRLKSEPYGFLWLNKRYSLLYKGQEFAVEYDEGNSQAGQIIDGETRIGFKIEEENFLTFTESVPAALPRQIPDASYEVSTKRDPFYLNIFYLSLALIITGVGFLKANISTIVGALYEKDDPRRDRGFTMFYMGINTGALLAPLIAGTIGQLYGWVYGFGLAGFGMLFGLVQFQRGQKYLYGHADPPDEGVLKEK